MPIKLINQPNLVKKVIADKGKNSVPKEAQAGHCATKKIPATDEELAPAPPTLLLILQTLGCLQIYI